ncbi:hypothetical protein [Rhodococcus chondri]|uniref:Uncharacterized protein n=1 Tax=Rhodococcus chondri TaxID=3065941 RepID=A0ABU7JTM7_9NOCA|nr:hypothetical protein [Rhodococcus sp. CC-R104]MEE2033377.1 hypothetical protein [Rhodococcus sp. CC-R104]
MFELCTREWSPRPRVRVDAQRMHDYLSTSAMPATAPTVPWAIHLAGTDHRFRLLAFDLDSGRHGADIARSDALRLCGVLDELGVAHLRTASGPTGGQHVWVRLAEPGASADSVRHLAHALRQHYPSLDTAPLTNPATGAVRPPGAPHRHGGYSLPYLDESLPYLDERALTGTLARMSVGTAPEVVQWLLARHPHTELPERPDRARAVRIIDGPAGPRLDRPRRPLTARTRALLTATPSAGTDRSALAHSILLGMATAGHSLADIAAAVDAAPGLVRLRDDRDRGRDDTARQWQRALAAAARFPVTTGDDRDPIDDELDRVDTAVTADPARWARPGGASDERILHALCVLARTARTRTLDIDVRRLAEAAAVHASTVSRRLRVLAGEGWVTRVRAGSGTKASTWELNLPQLGATQGEPAPAVSPGTPLALLEHHTHDVWSNRAGLGGAFARIHWAVLEFGKHVSSAHGRIPLVAFVAAATGYTRGTITRTLDKLHTLGLLPTSPGTSRKSMDRTAHLLGATGTAADRAHRHLVDRELHRWWIEELEWRRRPGKKRGVRPVPRGSLALPIAAPARARYGRFPTGDDGRADYHAARTIVSTALGYFPLPHLTVI